MDDVKSGSAAQQVGATAEESKDDRYGLALTEGVTIPDDQFKIVQMRIKDAESSTVFWEVKDWTLSKAEEQRVEFPKEMLQARAISREIVFFSKNVIEEFAIIQRMSMMGQVIEEHVFKFGFVIPNSTNSWDQTIEAEVGQVMPAEVLSGNLVVDTFFLAKEKVIAHTQYRIFYV